MTGFSWNEIRERAIAFSREWAGVSKERAEAQTFWNEFFHVFGVRRRLVASFEEPVRSLKDTYHRIDLFWKGRLLVEHKSAGESLDKAASQAFDYVQELAGSGRDIEAPRYIIVSDFHLICLYDLEPEDVNEPDGLDEHGYRVFRFELKDLHRHIRHFAFIIGQKTHHFGEEDPANLEAAQLMAELHDTVADSNYSQEFLERLLVRLLFCLFADDTGIFETNQFELYIENHTREDGTDLGAQLTQLFETLNTSVERRSIHLDEDAAAFPFVNGDLFAERLPVPSFNREMRNRLIAACRFDWSRISPAIFGSLFQGILDARERRQIGAHYTSERDILKIIRPLFLDDLHAEFLQLKDDRSTRRAARLRAFQQRLRKLTFLDPACGCGNFLVVAYRELRLLELDVLRVLHRFDTTGKELDLGEVAKLSVVDVDQFYGLEIGEWPARIAETALWLTDHQMNTELTLAAGNLFQRIPLRNAPHIRCANALREDWNDLLPAKKCSYVLGNPPFVGAKYQDAQQKADVRHVMGSNGNNHGLLDYVTMWYFRAADYIRNTSVRCAFVSTNSITQGEQVGILWNELFNRGIKIHFAHRTFAWQSEAKGMAHVHVVIIGFGAKDSPEKWLYEYENLHAEPKAQSVTNINPYLVEGDDIVLLNRSKPICDVPEIGIGNKPIDGGNYLFTEEEKQAFLKKEPDAEPYFKPWVGSVEFLHGAQRWCLWLRDVDADTLKALPECRKRIEQVRHYRLNSKSAPTRRIAEYPRRFHVENFPREEFLVIPEVSSEKRPYIPIGFLTPETLCSNLVKILPYPTLYHFGVLSSAMHMAWVRHVCGRLKSDYRYSIKLVYNNFPWPERATDAQRAKVETCAQVVLDIREEELSRGASLATIYDPILIPPALMKAHQAMDRAVDRCYRRNAFRSNRERVEFLFTLYETLTAPLAPSNNSTTRKRRRK